MTLFLKILKWSAIGITVAFAALVVYRMFVLRDKQKTDEQVAKIHATKLSLDDVMGKNLPPDPGADADKTIAGIDANHNGIRDDVELAIFKEYPNSAKKRGTILQYALVFQLQVTQPFLNSDIAGAIADKEDSAFFCIANTLYGPGDSTYLMGEHTNFVLDRQFNTEDRLTVKKKFYSLLKSGRLVDSGCDLDFDSMGD